MHGDKDVLAQKQSELSKALSAAYLNHQIAELESQVRQLPISQEVQRPHGIKQVASGNPIRPGSGPGQRPGSGDIKAVLGRIDDDFPALRGDEGDKSDRELDDEDEKRDEDSEEWRVAVLDVSGLMWAPKAVKNLVQKGFEVIIPADGIRTLDLLKKGNSPSAIAARSAARYIEHASRHHQLLSADPSLTVQLGTNYKRGRGLRIQRDDEYRRADELSSLPLMPGEEGPPKWVKSVLGCAAYFAGINKAEIETSFSRERDEVDPQPVLYVANPPLAVELAQATHEIGPETREMRDQAESIGNFLERGEGVVVLQEAERFELGLEVLRDEDDEALDMRRSANKTRGKGRDTKMRTAGGGARVGKIKREEEKQPEVKILLRRQPVVEQTDSADHSQGQENGHQIDPETSPMLDHSPLPDPTLPPPPAGLLLATHDGLAPSPGLAVNGTSSLVKGDSIGSYPSADVSPPRQPAKHLPTGNKSPASKFVPLSRETHPVRRRAGSSNSDYSDHSRPGHGGVRGGRGGARGGGIGRGGGRAGAGKSKRGKEKDSEFKNGNFTLLQRPTPPPPPPAPAPAIHDNKPAQTPSTSKNIADRPVRPRTAPVVRGILARPPRGGMAHNHSHGRPPPPPGPGPGPGPPPRFAQGGRGIPRGRGRGAHHGPPPAFEFDDAMLRPGFGPNFHDGHGHHHGPPPPSVPHRGRQPLVPGHGHVPIWGGGHGLHPGHGVGSAGSGAGPGPGHLHLPPDWRPAPEKSPAIILQRPK